MNSQYKFAAFISVIILIFGFIDIFLSVVLIGFVNGISSALNDPGKSLFHILFLPLAVLVFIGNFSFSEIFRLANKNQKRIITFIAIAGIFITLIATLKDHVEGMCTRFSYPDAFASDSVRKSLLSLQSEQHKKLKKVMTDDEFAEESKKSYNLYKEKLSQVRDNDCSWKYWSLTSVREKWSLFLSCIAALFVVFVFLSLIVHLIIRQRPSEKLLSAYIVVMSLLVPWLALRSISEWYVHFGYMKIDSYPSLYIGIIMATLCAVLLFVLNLRRRVQLIAMSLLTGIPGALSLIGALRPEWFGVVAQIWYVLDIIDIAIIYCILAVSTGSLIWYILSPEAEPGDFR